MKPSSGRPMASDAPPRSRRKSDESKGDKSKSGISQMPENGSESRNDSEREKKNHMIQLFYPKETGN